jgi:AcrR family transcriptional regulator
MACVTPPSQRAERYEATRAELLAVARVLFAEHGYAGVRTEEVVQRAGVTRGALYHHFKDKKDLFRAVYEALERQLAQDLASGLTGLTDPWETLVVGLRGWLDACQQPDVMQIALIDAPAVLGHAEWREIGARYGLGLISAGLEAAMATGAMRRQPVQPLARMILGAMSEAGMLIASQSGDAQIRAQVEEATLSMLSGLRK